MALHYHSSHSIIRNTNAIRKHFRNSRTVKLLHYKLGYNFVLQKSFVSAPLWFYAKVVNAYCGYTAHILQKMITYYKILQLH